MPRRQRLVWNYFENLSKGRRNGGCCTYCKKQIYGVNKMEKHLSKCINAPSVIKKLFSGDDILCDDILKYIVNIKISPLAKGCLICGSPIDKNSLLSFHRFPKNHVLRRAWLEACKLEENDVSSFDVLCSKHFREDDFDSTIWPERELRLDAVPAPSTCYLKPKVKTAASHKSSIDNIRGATATRKRCKTEIDNVSSENSLISSERNIDGVCSYSTCVPTASREKLCKREDDLKKLCPQTICDNGGLRSIDDHDHRIGTQLKKINFYRSQTKRLDDRIESILNLVSHLKEKGLISDKAAETILRSC